MTHFCCLAHSAVRILVSASHSAAGREREKEEERESNKTRQKGRTSGIVI